MSELAVVNDAYSIMENVVADGDLSKLSPKQRVEYYHRTCESLGLNPLTRPLEYQRFNGKVVLYARKEASEQLRFIHKVSIYKMEKETFDGVFVVTAYARTGDGKEDISTGAVPIANLKGEALANAFMKAETKAKRRVTLSVCGMGFLDENEVNTIPGSKPVDVNFETGEIIQAIEKPPYTIEVAIQELNSCRDEDHLREIYQKAYHIFKHLPEELKHLVTAKDIRKTDLATQKAEYKQAQEDPLDGEIPTFKDAEIV